MKKVSGRSDSRVMLWKAVVLSGVSVGVGSFVSTVVDGSEIERKIISLICPPLIWFRGKNRGPVSSR